MRNMKKNIGSDTPQWKGERAKYSDKHKWHIKHIPKPQRCEFCKKEKKMDWANISGEYYRTKHDWISLCKPCHAQWDRLAQKTWRTRRKETTKLCGLDFDGVICQRTLIPSPKDFRKDEPMPGAIESIKALLDLNIECYVSTARPPEEWKNIVLWLYTNNFPGMQVCNIKKPNTFIYIDDRAIRFTNWQDIRKYLG